METKRKILVVDDNLDTVAFLKFALEDTFTVIGAYNGKDALRICQDDSDIDVILMDGEMPIMNGFEAAKAIKEIRPSFPIICIATDGISSRYEKCFVNCLKKPFSLPDQLMPLIEGIIKKS